MKPVIGIIICGNSENKQFVSASYIEAITYSGGIPLVIPCPLFEINSQSIHQLPLFFPNYYTCCDGFLFCGGEDISPLLYEQPPLSSQGKTDLKMDLFHIAFMQYLLEHSKPVLAICRGMQVLNAALGGTLYQDLSLRKEPSFCHMQLSVSREEPAHTVTFLKGSKLYDIFKIQEHVNSFHHQSIQELGVGIISAGQSDDGVIEAIEVETHPFAIGVQWHPECMYKISKRSQKLFRIFCSFKIFI